jgi:hypothetical protein
MANWGGYGCGVRGSHSSRGSQPTGGLSASPFWPPPAPNTTLHYNGAIQQLKSSNWAGFGAELDALRPLLEELSQHSAGREPFEEAPSFVRPKDKLP